MPAHRIGSVARRWILSGLIAGAAFSPGWVFGQTGEGAGAASAPATQPAPPDRLQAARALFAELLAYSADLSPAQREKIPSLLIDLGSASWSKREAAGATLAAMPPAAIPLLAPVAEGVDLEAALRAKAILAIIERRSRAGDGRLSGAVEARAAAGDTLVIGDLISLLAHPSSGVRYAADYALHTLTAQGVAFDPFADEPARAAGTRAWGQWWAQAKAGFRFDPAAQGPMAIFVVEYIPCTVGAYKLDGTLLWSRRVPKMPYSAWPTSNGNLLVASLSGSPGLEELDPEGKVVWTSDALGLAGLRVLDVRELPNGRLLLADGQAQRVIEVDRQGKIYWQASPFANPNSAQRLVNGNTLVSEHSGRSVTEVDREGKRVWAAGGLNMPMDATGLPNGNVLLAECNAQRVVELDRSGRCVWQRACTSSPYSALRLGDGSTVIGAPGEGVYVVDTEGSVIRRLVRLRLLPQALLEKAKPVAATNPAPIEKSRDPDERIRKEILKEMKQ
ncbi:MAG: PQQ-binding-like beta-propeller repeat protein [Planctomycetota bacterium]|nr:PQQ-binding-like beta-propeller repeat protein [Planctomycetota bacterium]